MSARFFIDQCVPRSVGESLKKAGYQVSMFELGLKPKF